MQPRLRVPLWECVILLSGMLAAASLAWTWARDRGWTDSGAGPGSGLDEHLKQAGPTDAPAADSRNGPVLPAAGQPRQECSTCGAARPRDFSHPVLARLTVAAASYLAAAKERGPSAEDVAELRALVLITGEGDAGDAAVYAVRAAGEWVRAGTDPVVARDTLDVLVDATSDGRQRVRRNARAMLLSLSGAT